MLVQSLYYIYSLQRLEPIYGPVSRSVLFLARFAGRRAVTRNSRPLAMSLKTMLGEQDKLYVFMNFMKSRNAIHVLQVYLTLGVCVCIVYMYVCVRYVASSGSFCLLSYNTLLNYKTAIMLKLWQVECKWVHSTVPLVLPPLPDDLKLRVSSCTKDNALDVLSQVETLYGNYLLPSSPTYLPLENAIIMKLTEGYLIYIILYTCMYVQLPIYVHNIHTACIACMLSQDQRLRISI